MNTRGGPWAFWIEVKGPETPTKVHQWQMGYKLMAANVPWFVVRHPNEINDVLELVNFANLGVDFRGEYSRESDVQKAIKRILEVSKFTVIDTSQGFRPGGKRHGTTRITLGTPDLYCFRHSLPRT